MEQIRAGGNLAPPPPALPPVNDMRSSLMEQIRAGGNLKHVDVEVDRDRKFDSRFAYTLKAFIKIACR